jgi:hypothetical protein
MPVRIVTQLIRVYRDANSRSASQKIKKLKLSHYTP